VKTLRVLIAESERPPAAGLKSELEALGHHVVGLAKDGLEAVAMAERLCPDLVLMDVRMPRLDGLEAAKRLHEAIPTPVIFLAAEGDLQLAAEAGKVGALGYLLKPVNGQQLQPAIQVAMSRFEEIASLRRAVLDLKEGIEARKQVERAKGILMKRLRLDEGEAFGLLQRRSRNTRKPMAEVASHIIAADTFFADLEKDLHAT